MPLAALFSGVFGIMIGFPVLRLRGDYLAIVTLAFGEIVKLVLENWNDFSFGPSGIANIPRPMLFGQKLRLAEVTNFTYFHCHRSDHTHYICYQENGEFQNRKSLGSHERG